MMKKIVIILLALMSVKAFSIDTLKFDTDAQRLQFQVLTEELRCPKCQNQNIADSNAPIAKDLRNEVHRMILEGNNEEQVVNFMVERYGNFVVYKPKFDTSTYLLWLGPALIAFFGFIIVVMTARKKRLPASSTANEIELSKEEKKQLNTILSEDKKV
jgi:cytochrome c-type biogenesis protein CcmH